MYNIWIWVTTLIASLLQAPPDAVACLGWRALRVSRRGVNRSDGWLDLMSSHWLTVSRAAPTLDCTASLNY